MSTPTALAIINDLETSGILVLRGVAALRALRSAVELAVRDAGISIQFDPTSDSTLTDYLGVAAGRGLEGAATGAICGLLLGALFGRAGEGVLLGASLGGLGGAVLGVQDVNSGWRIHAVRDSQGQPVITVRAK